MALTHPWQIDLKDLMKKSQKTYNVTPFMPEWHDVLETENALRRNSFAVPMYTAYVILGSFTVVVLIIALLQLVKSLECRKQKGNKSRSAQLARKHVLSAPLFRLRHAEPIKLIGRYLTFQLPLRGDAVLLYVLILANFLPIFALYTPYRKHNYKYPTSKSQELLRYVSDRSAVLAVMQLPLAFLLAGRNNFVIWLTGTSFDRCLLYHRWLSRCIAIHAITHAACYSIFYVRRGGLSDYQATWQKKYLPFGAMAVISISICLFLSVRYLRQKSYETFVAIHKLFALVALIGIFCHVRIQNKSKYSDFIIAISMSGAFYAFDNSVRLARMVFYSISVRKGAGMGFSMDKIDVLCQGNRDTVLRHHVVLPRHIANAEESEGKFVQLWLPRLQPFSHPYSIAQAQCGVSIDGTMETTNLYFYAKVRNGITQALCKRSIQVNATGNESKMQHLVFVDGFYGKRPPVDQFEASFYVAGGIGITTCAPLFLRSAPSCIGGMMELHWIIPESALLSVLIDILRRQSMYKKNVRQDGMDRKDGAVEVQASATKRIVIHYTLPLAVRVKDDGEKAEDLTVRFQHPSSESVPGMDKGQELRQAAADCAIQVTFSQHYGRPDVRKLVSAFEQDSDSASRFCFVSCGPASLCDHARQAARRCDAVYYEQAYEW